MIKTNTSRWYDVECDAPNCERLASMEYRQCDKKEPTMKNSASRKHATIGRGEA